MPVGWLGTDRIHQSVWYVVCGVVSAGVVGWRIYTSTTGIEGPLLLCVLLLRLPLTLPPPRSRSCRPPRMSDTELRGLTRERLEAVVNGFREVLKRGHRSSEAFRRVERLQLDLALKLYRYVGVV